MNVSWLEAVLNDRDERAILRSGRRYMSNITVVQDASALASLPPDVLLTPLNRYTAEGAFTGRYAGPGRGAIEKDFARNLARIYDNADTPRLSGVQIKAPMHLDASGELAPSIEAPFTHILKPAGTGGFEGLPLVEWTALELGRAVGFVVPTTALVAMPDGMPSALVVERFDIRKDAADTRLIAMEDMCSVLDLPAEAKYDGTMERVANAVRAISTAPQDDVLLILKRALFAWLIADGDMHLKNMAMLKTAEPDDLTFRSVRLAPLYDAVTTRVFPRLSEDRMALKLNGKDERLKRSDFRMFASTAGIRASDADAAIDDVVNRLRSARPGIVLPAPAFASQSDADIVERMLEICINRTESFI